MSRIKTINKAEQVLFGSILGDGCISKCNNYYTYTENHSVKQKEYIIWKNQCLRFNFYFLKKRNQYCINKGDKKFKVYRDLFYKKDKKTINKQILDSLTPLSLAVWYMDDGSYIYSGKSIRLYTYDFKRVGNLLIKNWLLKKFDIKSKIYKSKNAYYLGFNVENSKKFIELIKKYIIPSMSYKIGLDEKRINKSKRNVRLKKQIYYRENRDKILLQRKIYHSKNREKELQYLKNYREKNKFKGDTHKK